MVRKITQHDKTLYLTLAQQFYHSDAVLHPVATENLIASFEEMMRSACYLEGYFIEYGQETAGFALIAKTFSQEVGGMVIWIEELFILPQYRCAGLGRTFFEQLFGSAPRGKTLSAGGNPRQPRRRTV